VHEPERYCSSEHLWVSHKTEGAEEAKLSSAQSKLIYPG